MSMNPPEKKKMEDLQLNRENKRKQYEKGYYKKHPCNETNQSAPPFCDSTGNNNLTLVDIYIFK